MRDIVVGSDMGVRITEEDVGKRVVGSNGEVIGTIVEVEGDTAYVEPAPSITEKIRSRMSYESVERKSYPLIQGAVGNITDDEIYLKEDFMDAGSGESTSETTEDPSRWRRWVREKTEFIDFLKTTLSLFKEADDPDAFAESLSKGEIEEALEQTDMTEEKLAKRVDDIESKGEEALEDPVISEAVARHRGGDNGGHSD